MGLTRIRKRPKAIRVIGSHANGQLIEESGKRLTARSLQEYRIRSANHHNASLHAMEAAERLRIEAIGNEERPSTNIEDDWLDTEMDIDDVLNGDAALNLSHEGGEFYEIVEDYLRQQKRPRVDRRNRRDRVEKHQRAFNQDIEGIVNSYLAWYASLGDAGLGNDSPPESECNQQGSYTILVVDTFAATHTLVALREGDTSPASAFLRQGFVPCSPHSPTVAVTVRVLELYRNMSQRCPRMSVQPFVKSLCDLHTVPFCPYLCKQFSACFDLYLSIRDIVGRRIQVAIGRDSPNWRLKHACPACTYKLEGEPKLIFDMLVTMDGNDSLKRIQKRRPTHIAGLDASDPLSTESSELVDSRKVGGDYYLTRERVDRWAHEVVEQLLAEGYAPYQPTEEENPNECEERWTNMANELVAQMWGIFDETGIFLALCRHGFALVVADMVKTGERSKYPLSVVEALLEAFGPNIGGGYDIGCKFGTTLNKSPLGQKARNMNYQALVGSFHGHAHNRRCQLRFLATYVKGMGLEDLEGCERFFSKSNHLASSVRHASVFHRRQRISGFLCHMDNNETYQSLSTFLTNNYKQALEIINGEGALKRQMDDQNLSDYSIFETWLDEERVYLQGLSREPLPETLAMDYVKGLAKLNTTRQTHAAAIANAWQTETPMTVGNTPNLLTGSRAIETTRRHAQENVDKSLAIVQDLELKLGIVNRWIPADPEWLQAEQLIVRQKYQRCLDRLEGLVVSRMFELSKMNMSQTGYKMRKHIRNALKARSKAIRTALEQYNAAARALNPPRAELSWDSIVEYAFLADFDLLADSREDVRLRPWARPAARTLRDQYFKIERAREEISRLNVEIPRLATYIHDEEAFLLEKETELRLQQPSLAIQLQQHCLRLINSNDVHLENFIKLNKIHGFSGSTAPATALNPMNGGSTPSMSMPVLPHEATRIPSSGSGQGIATESDDESADEAEQEAEAYTVALQVAGLGGRELEDTFAT